MARDVIRDSSNRVLAFYEHRPNGEIAVYSSANQLLGTATEQGTFDAQRKKVSPAKDPGLLLKR